MLVLTRQRDQSVFIGKDISITVTEIRGDKVRLGISAPRDVRIDREEIAGKIKAENVHAAALQPGDISGLYPHPKHAQFLRAAIAEARLSLAEGGFPIGSALVRNDQIIGRGHSRVVQ